MGEEHYIRCGQNEAAKSYQVDIHLIGNILASCDGATGANTSPTTDHSNPLARCRPDHCLTDSIMSVLFKDNIIAL